MVNIVTNIQNFSLKYVALFGYNIDAILKIMNSKLKSIWKTRFTSAKILGPQKLLRLLRNWLISSRKNDENNFSETRNGSKSIRKIPNGLHCFTISVNSYGSSTGYFKLELEFADRSHEIDYSTIIFTHSYTVCYESLPLTLKLILNNGQISGNGANGVMFDIDGADIKGLKCVISSSGCAIGHSNADANDEAYKACSIDWNRRLHFFNRSFCEFLKDRFNEHFNSQSVVMWTLVILTISHKFHFFIAN